MYVVGIYEVKVTQLCLTLCDPRSQIFLCTLSMEFSRQEYWSGFPFPFPGDIPDPKIEPGLPHCMWILYHSLPATRETCGYIYLYIKIQLTFAQHRFELYRSTYTYFFLLVNIIVLHDPRFTESMDMEGRLLIICGFSTKHRVGDPNTCAKDRVCVCV